MLDGVQQVPGLNGTTRLQLEEGVVPQDVLRSLVASGIVLEKFEIAVPTLAEIFIHVVEKGGR